jgi:hypothetical protein
LLNRPEEALFFNKKGPFNLNTPQYQGKPLSPRVSKFYDHYNFSPTNSFLLKERKKRGRVLHNETHPGLETYWGKSGLKANETFLDGAIHSSPFRLPTHSSHEFRGAITDMLYSLENTLWIAGKHLRQTLSAFFAGPEFLGKFTELALMPLRLIGAVVYSIVESPQLDLIPDIGLKVGKVGLDELDEFLNPKDPVSFFSIIGQINYIFSLIAFFFGIALMCIKFII